MDFNLELGTSHSWLLDLGIAALGTAFGALSGSWFSYRLERLARQKELHDRNIAAGNIALAQLYKYWHSLVSYKVAHIEAVGSIALPWIHGPASYPRDIRDSVRFDIPSLSFLLFPEQELIPSLMVLQTNNRSIFQLMERRFHLLEEVSKIKLPNTTGERDEGYWTIALQGSHVKVSELKAIYNNINLAVNQELVAIKQITERVQQSICNKYPDAKNTLINPDFNEDAIREMAEKIRKQK